MLLNLLIVSALIAQTTDDCSENPWGVETFVDETGECFVTYEDYDTVARAIDHLDNAPLQISIPQFELLIDSAGRRFARIKDLDGDGNPDRIHVRLGDPDIHQIHKSVSLSLTGLFYVQEVPPAPCPSCHRPFELWFAPVLGVGFHETLYGSFGINSTLAIPIGHQNMFVRSTGFIFNGGFHGFIQGAPSFAANIFFQAGWYFRFPFK